MMRRQNIGSVEVRNESVLHGVNNWRKFNHNEFDSNLEHNPNPTNLMKITCSELTTELSHCQPLDHFHEFMLESLFSLADSGSLKLVHCYTYWHGRWLTFIAVSSSARPSVCQ